VEEVITFKQYLEEQRMDTLVYAFGRYSPPTRGHITHFHAVREYARKNGFRYELYVSKTVDNKKNPIPVEDKIAYIKKAAPEMLPANPATNMFSIVEGLANSPIKRLVYFAGGDYFEEGNPDRQMFSRLEAFAAEKGITLSVQSSGERSGGISGTALRQAAMNDDFETFLKASPIGMGRITEKDVRYMFELTKRGLAAPATPAPKRVKKPVV
jgi:hypothetical protein